MRALLADCEARGERRESSLASGEGRLVVMRVGK